MPTKEQFHTRLDEDDAAALEEYQDTRNLTTAEAVRRLIQSGLEAETEETPDWEELQEEFRENFEADGRDLTTMRQMGSQLVGSVAVSIGAFGLVNTLLPALSAGVLVVLLAVGLLLIGYGAAPLFATEETEETAEGTNA